MDVIERPDPMLFLLAFLLLFAVGPDCRVRATGSRCPDGWVLRGRNDCYKFVSTRSLNWLSAEMACQSEGAHLVSIHSQQEQDFIFGRINTRGSWWLGLNDRVEEGTYVWSDGSVTNVRYWDQGEPTGDSEDCVHMSQWLHQNKWNDRPCSQRMNYICKKGVLCPNGWVLRGQDECYRFVSTNSRTWLDAEATCVSAGSHLVSIHSSQEQQFVHDNIDSSGTWWLGLNDRSVEGTYRWSDGTSTNVFFWDNGEPTGWHNRNEDCVHMSRPLHQNKWNDRPCNEWMNFICKKVLDFEDPRITCPSDQNVTTDPGEPFATIRLPAPSAVSDDSGRYTVRISIGLRCPSTFRVGYVDSFGLAASPLLLHYSATDPSQNIATCQMRITIVDNEEPSIFCPANIRVSIDTGESFATISLPDPRSVVDNAGSCTVAIDVNGSQHEVGDVLTFFLADSPHMVEYTATDASGNSASCHIYVTVFDSTPPTFTTGCPDNIYRQTDIKYESVLVTWSKVNATDPSSPLLWASNHQPGDMFPVGNVTAVTYVVTDQQGNSAYCNFTVTVTGVGLECPANVTTVAPPGRASAEVTWVPAEVILHGAHQEAVIYLGSAPDGSTRDTNDREVLVSSDYQSGVNFHIGDTRVTYYVQGLGIKCEFYVSVLDTTPPRFITSCPGNITRLVALSTDSVSVTWPEVNATDPSSPLQWAPSHQPGDMFATGNVTVVTYVVTDQEGNSSSCTFTVTVTGVGLVCPGNVTALANPGRASANVSWALPDVVFNGPPQEVVFDTGLRPHGEDTGTADGLRVRAYSDHHPGDSFDIGATTVAYHVGELSVHCQFHVIVLDTFAPRFFTGCPDNIYRLVDISVGSVAVSWPEVTATDPSLPLLWASSHRPGDMFQTGNVTSVTYVVTDQEGNSTYCNFTVAVTGVGLGCPANVTAITKPGKALASVMWAPPDVIFEGVHQNVIVRLGNRSGEDPRAPGQLEVFVYSDDRPGNNFSIGATPVTYHVRELGIQCHFRVTVIDNEPPEIYHCPGDVTIPVVSSSNETSHSWLPPVISDNSGDHVNVTFACQGTTPIDACHRSGNGTFSIGDTNVTYTATDVSGNANLCSFTVSVTVVDIVCPANVTTHADPGSAWTRVHWQEPDLTGWDGSTNFTSSTQPGALFTLGTHGVSYEQWFATYDLLLECSFFVAVEDKEPPQMLGCPSDIIIPVTSSSNQVSHSWVAPVVSDNSGHVHTIFGCLATIPAECQQAGSGTFPVGATMVIYKAVDASGNENVCDFAVTVTVVNIICPANVTALANPGATRTSVSWPEPDLTGWDEPTNFTSNAIPGDVFPLGINRVSYQQWFATNDIDVECSFSVLVVGRCAPDTSRDGLTWPVTKAGSTAKSVERCSFLTRNSGLPIAVRNCSIVAPPVYFQWEELEYNSCGEVLALKDIEKVPIIADDTAEVATLLANRTSEISIKADDIAVISKILVNIVKAGSGNPVVTEAVLETVSNVLNNAEAKTDSCQDRYLSTFIQSVQSQVAATLRREGRFSTRQDTIHVEAVSLDPLHANGFCFASIRPRPLDLEPGPASVQTGTLTGSEVQTFVNNSDTPSDAVVLASVRLPRNMADLLPPSVTDDRSFSLRVSFIIYSDDKLFQSALISESRGITNLTVAGPVVSLAVEGIDLINLTQPVVIEFKTPADESQGELSTVQCVFWDFGLKEGVGDWSTAGCTLAGITGDKISCSCSHATNFAALVSHTEVPLDVEGQDRQTVHKKTPSKRVLDVPSQIGCVLSIITLGVTLITHLSVRNLRTRNSDQIIIQFCVSLLMLNIVFLAGVDRAKGTGNGCVFVAALLHYLTLTSVTWMTVEARNMYVSTVQVFIEDTRQYMVKACVVAWGFPVIVLTMTLAAASEHYNNGHFCFLPPGRALYLALLVPICLLLTHNILTLLLVMRWLLKIKEVSRSKQISRRLQGAVAVSALMVLTCCFGFLAVNNGTLVFHLIFCFTNVLQGQTVLVMLCFRRQEVRFALATRMKCICPGQACRLPSPRSTRSDDAEMVTISAPATSSDIHQESFGISTLDAQPTPD